MSIPDALPWLIPPLLGALIGYVTNAIAIRMLFRPLRPWHLLGLRLPLTPGIIPSKRGELAVRMGQMVGTHLMTSADVGAALARPAFRAELKGAVEEKLGRFFDRELGPVVELLPQEFRGRFQELVEHLRWKLVRFVFAYLESPEFERGLREYVHRTGESWLARDLESFLTPERYGAWQDHLERRVKQLLGSSGLQREVALFVDRHFDELLASGKSLREILPSDLTNSLLDQLEAEIPGLLERFGGMLYDPAFRERLSVRAREGIQAFLDSLDGLTGLLAGFVNLDKVYAQLPGFLDRAADEVARWLREEQTRRQVAGFLRERAEGFLARPLGSYLEGLPYDKVAGVRRFLRDQAVALLQGPQTAATLLQLLDGMVMKVKDRPFRVLLEQALPENGVARLQAGLADQVIAALRSLEARSAFESLLREQAQAWLFRKPVGRLSARIPADLRDELSEGLLRLLEELLRKEVPPLIETLNVQRIVEEKVNALDLLEVEGLLMGIMREQFKYINLFGALLGLLIGLVNLAVLALP